MDTLLALALGIGLAAACGLRVFVPLLVLGLAARAGWLTLAPGFSWLTGDAALLALAAATALEIAAYSVPWLDNLLDGLAGPAAVAAGVLAAGAVLPGDPLVRWTLAAVAGGGAAAGVQLLTTTARAFSSAATAGLANWALATVEAAGAVVLSLLALLLPLLAGVLALALLALAAPGARRLAAARRT